jgi:hypothetical protein
MEDSYINKVVKVKSHGIVSINEAKKQLNVDYDFTDDDIEITMLIEAARGAAEDYTGIDIASTENTLELIRPNLSQLLINEANFDSIVSITTTKDNVDTVLSSSDYEVKIRRIDFTILFKNTHDVDKMVIVFKTGYLPSDVPYQLKSAILVKINDLYDIERTSYVGGTKFTNNKTFDRLLNGFVVNRW